MLLIQADGASKGNPGPASFGAVIMYPDGSVAAEVYEPIGIATNNQAEYRAVIAALETVANLHGGLSAKVPIHIQMDSKLVIEQLAGRWKIKNPELQQLAIRAQKLMRGLDVKLEWIPRELNSRADALANLALTDPVAPPRSAVQQSGIQPSSIRAPRQLVEPTVVWAIRHGHTAMTEGGLISGGGADPELSDFGHREAQQIATEIQRLAMLLDLAIPEIVLHSPQLRATQTAHHLSGQLGVEMFARPELREIEFGEWEGVSMEQLSGISPAEVAAWRGSLTHRPPGGESLHDLEARVRSLLLRELEAPRSSIAFVAHMMPMRAIYRLASAAGEQAHWSVNFLPASVSVYRFFGDSFAEVFAVNSTSHLERLSKTD